MYAHSQNTNGDWHDLYMHLERTALRAEGVAQKIGIEHIAYAIGILHDIGKCNPECYSRC